VGKRHPRIGLLGNNNVSIKIPATIINKGLGTSRATKKGIDRRVSTSKIITTSINSDSNKAISTSQIGLRVVTKITHLTAETRVINIKDTLLVAEVLTTRDSIFAHMAS
jgi:hypothetical protein